jgi:hypothetical protein
MALGAAAAKHMEQRRQMMLSGRTFDALEGRLRDARASPVRLAFAVRRARHPPLWRWLPDAARALVRRLGLGR